ncbi:type VI secretion system Vgr family protein [Sulfurirhabdus autotrophica]|uniref:Rhs element Vgr protein n=1 Tax=Sulfurirhabdus autotrophica TaxID=1706046 RepID=A0A4R3XT47_9PROT|nr:type VI secretion system Vgr family protein [Sulfurirhabdus autotrophica]TCV81097.1 Rhs element Vgr protein [Sulfurirhabdus autotrophica]
MSDYSAITNANLSTQLPQQLLAMLSKFSSETRLYDISFKDDQAVTLELGSGGLLVEAFSAIEGLHTIATRDIIVLSTNAHIPLKSLIGQQASLQVSLSDGTRTPFTGLINQAAMLGSEGGLARYRIRLVPWLWLLSQTRTSRVWQDKTVIDIIETVFAQYSAHASWTWSDDVTPFMSDVRPRSYCVQYRETDLAFISRILAEEGLSWRLEEHAKAPSGHRMVFFADTTQATAFPADYTHSHALGGQGIRFHGAHAREAQDTIQAFGAKRTLHASLTTVLTYDYKAKQAIAASAPTNHQYGGKHAPVLESYDSPGLYTYANSAEAQRYSQLHMQAHEVRNKLWYARSTVRTLRPGTIFELTQGPLQELGDIAPKYAVLSVTSVGINNLPKPVQEGLAELFGPLPEMLEDCLHSLAQTSYARHATEPKSAYNPATAAREAASQRLQVQADKHNLAEVITQAKTLGYANRFEAIRADIPWRPVLEDGTGYYHNPRATAPGSQSAIVVGPNGETTPKGADEIYCDKLGRVRIRFHWQDQHGHDESHANAGCWVRVAQRSAGGGMGSQFLPRIGQEVLIQFIEGDIDRPILIGALYNGQGEGGTIPTPGGQADRQAILTVFDPAHDHSASAQGNLAGGNSPVWHGASSDSAGHRNAAAQWGIRSKEYGGTGYNQLVFDDTDNQGRIQLKTTQAASELNLGHLIHTADNHRGSFRGQGAELRTDAYGALRAGSGILLTSYSISHNAGNRTPAGDNAPGMAHLKQATQLGQSFNNIATTHQTVAYASHQGSSKGNTSSLDDKAAPISALFTAASGMLNQETLDQAGSDAQSKNTRTTNDKLPHTTDPIIALSAKAGLGAVAGQNLQLANGETVSLMSGQDSQFITGNQLRVQTGQAIGLLAGAVKPGDSNLGLQLIAAQQAIDIQAQSDEIKIQAKDMINIMSANAHIDWAAAKSISLSTAGGANITIEGGNITTQCPGNLTVHASQKSFTGATSIGFALPVMPQFPNAICIPCLIKSLKSGSALASV